MFQTQHALIGAAQSMTSNMYAYSYCPELCNACDASNACTSCVNQHYATSNLCASLCDFHCLTCTSATTCTSCVASTGGARVVGSMCACPTLYYYDIFPNATQC